MNEISIDLPYNPRWYQKEFEDAMFSGKRRAFILYHRRAGKDIACWCFMLYCALRDSPGTYFYILPTYRQGKRVIWEGIDEKGIRLINYLPKEAITRINNTEMKFELFNGSIVQIVGSENYDNLRGTNPKGVVFSEFAMHNPRIWIDVISPILVKNGGWAVFNTTPMGKNHAYDMWRFAEKSEDWYTKLLTIDDTGLINKKFIEDELKEGKSEEIIQQEYYCSFAQGAEGAYYAKHLNRLENEGRVKIVPYEPHAPVDTYWDIGVGDETVILLAQNVGNEIHIINMYRNQGEGLQHYARWLQTEAEKHDYVYGTHWAPHDIQVRELGSGARTRLEIAKDLGIKFRIVPKLPIHEGIELARGLFPRLWIDQQKCQYLLKALENYHKHFNEKLNVYSDNPVHDWSSHCADAFRYMSIVYNKSTRNTMSEEEAEQMQRAYFVKGM